MMTFVPEREDRLAAFAPTTTVFVRLVVFSCRVFDPITTQFVPPSLAGHAPPPMTTELVSVPASRHA
jgi:hypothetical protein